MYTLDKVLSPIMNLSVWKFRKFANAPFSIDNHYRKKKLIMTLYVFGVNSR